jgi:hypothetical protein
LKVSPAPEHKACIPDFSSQRYARKVCIIYDIFCEDSLQHMSQTDNWEADYNVVVSGNPPTWRLVHNIPENEGNNNEEHELEEAVISVQGIVLRRDELPPFKDKIG